MPNTIRPGYKLIDRYQLSQPYPTDLAGVEAWQAVDFALDRPVSVQLLSGPNAEAGAEAARRAALLNDTRLTKIIDVGSLELDGQTRHYIVTEPVAGPTLEELVTELPLDPPTTRAIIGELANALDEANQRGLHHVALRPSAVRVNNGRVMLTGLGIDAELGAAGTDLKDSELQDSLGLAALAYYALSGYWPLPAPAGAWRRADAPTLPLAPRTETGSVVPLRELVPGSDPALLDLADLAFGSGVAGAGVAGTGVAGTGVASVGVAGAEVGVTAAAGGTLRAPHLVARHLAPWAPLAVDPKPAVSAHLGAPVAAGPGVAGVGGFGAGQPGRKSVLAPGVSHPGTHPGGHPKTGRIPKAGHPKTAHPKTGRQPISVLPDDEPLHIRPTEELDRALAGPVIVAGAPHPVKPPRPRGVPATPIVLGLVLATLGGTAAWAAHNVITPFLNPPEVFHTVEPNPPAYAEPPYHPDGTLVVDPAPPAEEPELHPIVVSGEVVDPYGDGERALNAPAVLDGDPSTFWYTYTYASPQFGGLKPGVGFFIKLEQAAPVSSVTLYANGGGGHVEVRKTTPDDPSGGDLLGSSDFTTETMIEFGGDVELDSIMLWITELPQLPDGRYRLELREITVR